MPVQLGVRVFVCGAQILNNIYVNWYLCYVKSLKIAFEFPDKCSEFQTYAQSLIVCWYVSQSWGFCTEQNLYAKNLRNRLPRISLGDTGQTTVCGITPLPDCGVKSLTLTQARLHLSKTFQEMTERLLQERQCCIFFFVKLPLEVGIGLRCKKPQGKCDGNTVCSYIWNKRSSWSSILFHASSGWELKWTALFC